MPPKLRIIITGFAALFNEAQWGNYFILYYGLKMHFEAIFTGFLITNKETI